MTHATILAKPNEGEAPRLSPLEACVAWVANIIRTIAGMKRRKVFPKNWKDHWEGLRQLEWCWDQMFAACAAEVLSGGSLDRDIGFELVMDVPANYGRPCPSTPQDMNRRFILIQRLRLDPDMYILRHIRRIAKREGIALDANMRRDPLRHAPHATSPGFAGGGLSAQYVETSSTGKAGGGGMRVLHAHDGGGLAFNARGPPPTNSRCLKTDRPCLAATVSETADSRRTNSPGPHRHPARVNPPPPDAELSLPS